MPGWNPFGVEPDQGANIEVLGAGPVTVGGCKVLPPGTPVPLRYGLEPVRAPVGGASTRVRPAKGSPPIPVLWQPAKAATKKAIIHVWFMRFPPRNHRPIQAMGQQEHARALLAASRVVAKS